ncbi:MAG TPA: hypothetical protein GX525_04685 [Bacilli bacterium]|nr:hypothetical protein [Bacilli bacterium]
MKQQSYENHTRYHPLQHFFWLPVSLITLVTSLIYVVSSLIKGSFTLPVFLIFMLVLMSFVAGALARLNALKVQDRVIRLEEQFRYYMLTKEPLDPRVTMEQLIALRFSSDEEFPQLAKLAVEKDMSGDEIKKAIKQWRTDEHRV